MIVYAPVCLCVCVLCMSSIYYHNSESSESSSLRLTRIRIDLENILTRILQSWRISRWAAIYVHDEYDDNLFTNDEVREARYALHISKMIIWYSYVVTIITRRISRTTKDAKSQHCYGRKNIVFFFFFLWNTCNFTKV